MSDNEAAREALLVRKGLADKLVVEASPGIKEYYASDRALDAAVRAFGARYRLTWKLHSLRAARELEDKAARDKADHVAKCKVADCYYCARDPLRMSFDYYELKYSETRATGNAEIVVRAVCVCKQRTCLRCAYHVKRVANIPDAPRAPAEPPRAPRKRRRAATSAKDNGASGASAEGARTSTKRPRGNMFPNVARQLLYADQPPPVMAVIHMNVFKTIVNMVQPPSHQQAIQPPTDQQVAQPLNDQRVSQLPSELPAVQPTPSSSTPIASVDTIISSNLTINPQFIF